MKFSKENLVWTREPKHSEIADDKIVIYTDPGTDLWQRTYYGFQNDNAPVLQIRTTEKYFSFTVKTEFESKVLFDQCGIVLYLNSENWLKASIEYENEQFQRLGSVVNRDIPAGVVAAGNPCRVLRAITDADREKYSKGPIAVFYQIRIPAFQKV